jgi:hypothetical protein
MEFTTYGYRLPETGDTSKTSTGWFASMEFNISRLDAHNHDGNNSPLLTMASFAPYTNTAAAASWAADGSGGGYKQTITVPTGITEINDYHVEFIFTAPAGLVGQRVNLGMKRLTATTFEIYCNDVTAAFTIVYR